MDECTDNRFELIEKYKNELIENTNINTSEKEMEVIESILFRFWQMGWLKRWTPVTEGLPKKKGFYLVTRKNPKGFVTKASYDPSRVERGVYNSPWGNGDSDILAWMELPKPYKGGKE